MSNFCAQLIMASFLLLQKAERSGRNLSKRSRECAAQRANQLLRAEGGHHTKATPLLLCAYSYPDAN